MWTEKQSFWRKMSLYAKLPLLFTCAAVDFAELLLFYELLTGLVTRSHKLSVLQSLQVFGARPGVIVSQATVLTGDPWQPEYMLKLGMHKVIGLQC